MSPVGARARDAGRSRAAIVSAAERLFAERGYDGTTLADIGDAAGVSRGTPGYFFGSKEDLYAAVLERLHRDRDGALGPPFARLADWGRAERPDEPLADVLGETVDEYLRFLQGRPTFVALIEREALAGGARLAAVESESTVMEDAFNALRHRAGAGGLRDFDVAEVVICLVALALTPLAHRDTMLERHGLDPYDERFVARRREHIVDVLMYLLVAR